MSRRIENNIGVKPDPCLEQDFIPEDLALSILLPRNRHESMVALLPQLEDKDTAKISRTLIELGNFPEGHSALEVNLIADKLDDSDPFIRRCAARAIGKIANEHCVEPLRAALQHSDPEVGAAALEGLKNEPHPRFVAVLIEALADDRVSQGVSLAPIHYELVDDELTRQIEDLAQHEHPAVKRGAEFALSAIYERPMEPEPGEFERLTQELKDSDPAVRGNAASELGTYMIDASLEPLEKALKDSDPEVRRAAAAGFGAENPRFLPMLIEALADTSSEVVAAVRFSLLGFRYESYDDKVRAQIAELTRHRHPSVREYAKGILSKAEQS